MSNVVEIIKKHCLDNLGNLLGSYTLPSGVVEKAIAVNPSIANQVYPPDGTNVSGLECQIYLPFTEANSLIDSVAVKDTWSIYLKQWDLDKTTLQGMICILKNFPYTLKGTYRNPPNRAMNQPEINRLDFYCWWGVS